MTATAPGSTGRPISEEETSMRRKLMLVAALAAGWLFATPRHAWAQG